MRTTLTLDEDVAVAIERLRKDRDSSFKAVVNEVMRAGLKHMRSASKPAAPFRTRAVSLGPCLIGNIDNVADALAIAEGESFK